MNSVFGRLNCRQLMVEAIFSGFFAAIAPFFFKLTALTSSSINYPYFVRKELTWIIWPWNLLMIALLLICNTVSVKYKMISFKFNGAFVGTTLIFVFTYIFSVVLDLLDPTNDSQYQPWTVVKQLLGAVLMVVGTCLVAIDHFVQEEQHKMEQTLLEGPGEDDFGLSSCSTALEDPSASDPRL